MSSRIYNTILAFCAFVVTWMIYGCAYPNQFRNAPPNQPHATLTTKNTEGFFGGSIAPFFINNQPTAFWRVSDTFRLRPGLNEIVAVYGGNAFTNPPREYEPLRFRAAPGQTYTLQHVQSDKIDSATITHSSAPLSPTVARARKQGQPKFSQ